VPVIHPRLQAVLRQEKAPRFPSSPSKPLCNPPTFQQPALVYWVSAFKAERGVGQPCPLVRGCFINCRQGAERHPAIPGRTGSGTQAGTCRQSRCLLRNSRQSGCWEKWRWFNGGSSFLKHVGFSADGGKSGSVGLIPPRSASALALGLRVPQKQGLVEPGFGSSSEEELKYLVTKSQPLLCETQPEPDLAGGAQAAAPRDAGAQPQSLWDGGGEGPGRLAATAATEPQSHPSPCVAGP